MNKLFSVVSLSLFLFFSLTSKICGQIPINDIPELTRVFNADRIEAANYKLMMYNQNKDTISRITVLKRDISRETYQSVPCIRITENNQSNGSNTRSMIYIDAKILRPLYYEYSEGDTVTQKASFENGNMTLIETRKGIEKKTQAVIATKIFLSNCFSEILQANDFSKNPSIKFETITPGRTANQFIVQRIGEKQLISFNKQAIDCWILKFTRLDNGKETPAGYRFVDKNNGKVLLFKTLIDSDAFFTYQVFSFN